LNLYGDRARMCAAGLLGLLLVGPAWPTEIGSCRWAIDWLGTADSTGAVARALAADGTVVGELKMGAGKTHAFVSTGADTTDLHPLLGLSRGSSSASVISDDGIVAGVARSSRAVWTLTNGTVRWVGKLNSLDEHDLQPVAVRNEDSVLLEMQFSSSSQPALAEAGEVSSIGESVGYVRATLPMRRGRTMLWSYGHYDYSMTASLAVPQENGDWRWVDLPGFGMGSVSVTAADGRRHVAGQAICGGESAANYVYCAYVADLGAKTQSRIGGWHDGERVWVNAMQRGAKTVVGSYQSSAATARSAARFVPDGVGGWKLRDIAPEGSSSSEALLVNKAGFIFGSAAMSGSTRYFLRDAHVVVWLDDLVPALVGASIDGVGLNDRNEFVGNVVGGGRHDAVKLSCR